jgi:hypothetical protein
MLHLAIAHNIYVYGPFHAANLMNVHASRGIK